MDIVQLKHVWVTVRTVQEIRVPNTVWSVGCNTVGLVINYSLRCFHFGTYSICLPIDFGKSDLFGGLLLL